MLGFKRCSENEVKLPFLKDSHNFAHKVVQTTNKFYNFPLAQLPYASLAQQIRD